ncbi:30S ribosomal protein S19 [uncultured archaeon]|nr:30S ribosomal protein S19 [uncultured archaeon]
MVRIDKYRGSGKKELESITMEDALPLLTSRARRALKRAMDGRNLVYKKLIKKVAAWQAKPPVSKPGAAPKAIRTHVRAAVILPSWVGLTFGVYSGKEFKPVVITPDKIGYRLGDFVHSTGRVLHSGPGIGATRGSKFIPLK